MRIFALVSISCLFWFCAARSTPAQTFDISSGGQPTITGALGGSVNGSANVRNDLSVTINFGEVSPANANNQVRVVVPIAVRSLSPYQVTVTAAGSVTVDPRAIQLSDIGFGVRNMNPLGLGAQNCTRSNHLFYAPFNNDPASSASTNSSGRVVYQSSLAGILGPTVILSGPRLTRLPIGTRSAIDGWSFDAVFVITPAYFSAGTTSITLNFTISAGPNVQC